MSAVLAERCRDCGPGYRLGDDGCRHDVRRMTTDLPTLAGLLDRRPDLADIGVGSQVAGLWVMGA